MKLPCLAGVMSAMLAFALYCPADPATQPATEAAPAAEACRQYCRQMNQGHGYDAVKNTWDFDALFDSAFGDAMKTVSANDRATMRADMLQLVGKVYTDPVLIDAMEKCRFTDFSEKDLPNHHARVNFTATLSDGSSAVNTLEFVHGEKGWRVVDAGEGGKMLGTTIAATYKKISQDETPQKFIHDMSQDRGG